MNRTTQLATAGIFIGTMLGATAGQAETTLPEPIVDVNSLLLAIDDMGFHANITAENLLTIQMPDNVRFVGKFSAYPHQPEGSANQPCGAITIRQGWSLRANAAPDIVAFQATCESGLSQNIIPVIAETEFHSMMVRDDLDYFAGNRYGTISVENVGVFLPDFYVLPLTTTDQLTLQSSGDPTGVVLQIDSINADESLNYILLSPTGKQRIWGGYPTVIEGEFIRGN